ncbi:MAG: hypothetical protein GY856_31870 [bacterium]|nr:hypothetical protein [bacterium]
MSETTTDFRASVATQVEAAWEASATHPSVDRWIGYRGGALAAEEERHLQRHLVGCRECVALVLDLEAFSRPEATDRSGISEFEVAAAWRAVRSAIDRDVEKEGWHLPATLAASFLVAALGLSTWTALEHRTVTELRRTVAELSQPQVNVPIRDLHPDTTTRSGSPRPATEVPAVARSFTLVLIPPEPQEFPDYQVEIFDSEGNALWSGRGLEMSPDGTFTLGLAHDFLAAAEHRVLLYGLDGDRRVLIQSYTVQILP